MYTHISNNTRELPHSDNDNNGKVCIIKKVIIYYTLVFLIMQIGYVFHQLLSFRKQ